MMSEAKCQTREQCEVFSFPQMGCLSVLCKYTIWLIRMTIVIMAL